MRAILSDVHGNIEALDAVLADIGGRAVTSIYSLGDIIGYGPNPIECLDRAAAWDLNVLGNHDHAVLFDPTGFSPNAERAALWTRVVVECARREELWTFLSERPRQFRDGDFLFVHGSARNQTNEYVFPEDVFNLSKMARIGEQIDRYCFAGHTHVPGVFIEPEPGAQWQFLSPEEIDHTWRLDERKTIVNVGSVGQPRDANWRACYVTLDGLDLTFHRVGYDVDATVKKIYSIPELSNFLADRLREGR
ncbi:diadenosine tetraphosphatase [Gemmata obscuriglobus]|uniref:Phosphoesterase n=1 Tax=Gemmata obscuriglobus TaxID=114 RepID=A0A2Z3GR51_9BACT|nr:metallophosphoesterase family protein [Gemmata obscuriglobus]AWM36819.1 phosphoesterase [Gemmata obscuriglobus]QEG30512.1 diadenosine tetraphosphatase [Gemmata obscuriglobus]VTS09836.1 Metallophosphoesterase OS=Planctomyces brasiliensis (strain ATCC 49424 / DSM 5305 / JCM 21570 / NBRC 103401 / IFAM 1448) GN=Plabr_0624 PE=4 SV=1: Metallophos_2 [Gemmata obscuriglobus UQM 2246]